jgi:ABC-type transport system involved in multi-copper enzyme maturation permease subunit
MINVIKNEFISTKKSALLVLNILITATAGLFLFTSIKSSGINTLTQYQIIDVFFKSTLNLLAPFILILVATVITESFNNGCLKIYLINPISRNEVLIGKSVFIFINILITMIIQIFLSFIVACVLTQVSSMNTIVDVMFKYLVTLIPVFAIILTFAIPGVLMKTSRNTMSFGFVLIAILNVAASFYEKLNSYSIIYVLKNISVSNQDLISNSLISLVYIAIGFLVSSYIFSNREIQ